MEKLSISGGNRLFGEISISGMKNSALPIIFATILVEDECTIDNVPMVSDVLNAIAILKEMGAQIRYNESNSITVNTKYLNSKVERYDLISKMRASSYLMGTMLSRYSKVKLPFPGGCNFGVRPLEQHFMGFEKLGAICTQTDEIIEISVLNSLKSEKITLDKISVGATINIVLASVFLDGITIIENAAIEPHVDDLIAFLNKCGAKILRNSRRIYCEGVKKLHGTNYKIIPDMIEALTYCTFLGACGGDITLTKINFKHLDYLAHIFSKMGFKIDTYYDEIRVRSDKKLQGAKVVTAPYPLFPTDLHPQFASLLCFTQNGGAIKDEIFPTRFAYLNELKKMGANTKLNENVVQIFPSKLKPANLDATDLRAGAALVCASLATEGESTVNNVNYIVRGYENLVSKIASLGGKIKLLKGE